MHEQIVPMPKTPQQYLATMITPPTMGFGASVAVTLVGLAVIGLIIGQVGINANSAANALKVAKRYQYW